MKNILPIIILLIGILLGYGISSIYHTNSKDNTNQSLKVSSTSFKKDSTRWIWADSLDAVRAAPENHHVIFENDRIRILEVILNPYEYEQLHTHKFPGFMFGSPNGSHTSGTGKTRYIEPPFDIIYYRYGYDSVRLKYYIKDSIKQHNDGGPSDDSASGHFMRPEGPHRIKNLSNVKIDVFRVEIKPENEN